MHRTSGENFRRVEWRTDSEGRVQNPRPFGDAELVNIEMTLRNITLTFTSVGYYDDLDEHVWRDCLFRVICKEPRHLSLDTDHLQNVVEDLWVIEDIERARAFKTFSGKNLAPSNFSTDAKFYVFITPITGIELFAACNEVEIWVDY